METPQAAGLGVNQTVQVVYLDGVVGKAYPWLLEPPDPTHPGPGRFGLVLGHTAGAVQ